MVRGVAYVTSKASFRKNAHMISNRVLLAAARTASTWCYFGSRDTILLFPDTFIPRYHYKETGFMLYAHGGIVRIQPKSKKVLLDPMLVSSDGAGTYDAGVFLKHQRQKGLELLAEKLGLPKHQLWC